MHKNRWPSKDADQHRWWTPVVNPIVRNRSTNRISIFLGYEMSVSISLRLPTFTKFGALYFLDPLLFLLHWIRSFLLITNLLPNTWSWTKTGSATSFSLILVFKDWWRNIFWSCRVILLRTNFTLTKEFPFNFKKFWSKYIWRFRVSLSGKSPELGLWKGLPENCQGCMIFVFI